MELCIELVRLLKFVRRSFTLFPIAYVDINLYDMCSACTRHEYVTLLRGIFSSKRLGTFNVKRV